MNGNFSQIVAICLKQANISTSSVMHFCNYKEYILTKNCFCASIVFSSKNIIATKKALYTYSYYKFGIYYEITGKVFLAKQ